MPVVQAKPSLAGSHSAQLLLVYLLLLPLLLLLCAGLVRGDFELALQSMVVTEVMKAASAACGQRMKAAPCSTQQSTVSDGLRQTVSSLLFADKAS